MDYVLILLLIGMNTTSVIQDHVSIFKTPQQCEAALKEIEKIVERDPPPAGTMFFVSGCMPVRKAGREA